jgi:hypothetical protein
MTALTTAAWVAHDIGLAAGFGGSLFGRIALNPAVKLISDKSERGQLVNTAWNGYNIVNAVGLGTAALTWFIGRAMLQKKSTRSLGAAGRSLVLAKDILMSTTVATGLVNGISGVILARQAPRGAVPMETGSKPAQETPRKAAGLQRLVNAVGVINLLSTAGVIGITAVLGNVAGKSPSWKFISRFLP